MDVMKKQKSAEKRTQDARVETKDNGLHPAVAAISFEQISWKMRHPTEGNGMSTEEIALAEREYRRFLTLIKRYPGVSHVPSRLVDKFWHAHILDTAAYRRDCDHVFGFYLDHFPYYGIRGESDKVNMEQSFAESNALYEEHFGEEPPTILTAAAARCEGHACHVESSCACRTPEACASVTDVRRLLSAARCQDHACHAPSSCACRAPGACTGVSNTAG